MKDTNKPLEHTLTGDYQNDEVTMGLRDRWYKYWFMHNNTYAAKKHFQVVPNLLSPKHVPLCYYPHHLLACLKPKPENPSTFRATLPLIWIQSQITRAAQGFPMSQHMVIDILLIQRSWLQNSYKDKQLIQHNILKSTDYRKTDNFHKS